MLSRLARVEEELQRRRPAPAPEMLGAIEIHCIGGASHFVEGEPCLEHEDCVYYSEPISQPLTRQYIFNWKEGMLPLDEMIG